VVPSGLDKQIHQSAAGIQSVCFKGAASVPTQSFDDRGSIAGMSSGQHFPIAAIDSE